MTQTKGKEMQAKYVMKMIEELPYYFDVKQRIFRLPDHEMKKKLCEPKVVSIGPYHYGKPGLQTMEHQKWFTLRGFLARNRNVTVGFYLQEMKSIEAKARQCYSEPIDLGSDEFVLMLLLDGCFILERLSDLNDYCYSIFKAGWNMMDVFYDLLLIENQLPFFVLHNLSAIQNQGVEWSGDCISEHCPFPGLIDNFLKFSNSFHCIQFMPMESECYQFGHLLQLYYEGVAAEIKLFSRSNEPVSNNITLEDNQGHLNWHDRNEIQLMCVSELCDAGVRFKKKKKPIHMLDISFANGTIKMPFLKIDSHFVRLMWNMVAHEQIDPSWDSPISSYLALMDALIDTEKDIAILERAGIVDSYFSNAEEAAVFFNQFGKLFVLRCEDHYFSKLFRDVRKYSESTWPKYRVLLVQDYFSSPWAIISVLAAVALFGLTGLQTYYTGKSV